MEHASRYRWRLSRPNGNRPRLGAVDQVLNISAYLFTHLDDPQQVRSDLAARAAQSRLKGTILLAHEGINLFLAGEETALRTFLDALREDPRLADLEAKESWSAVQPFQRLKVKVKNEIIRMDHPMIRPAGGRAPAVSPVVLRTWLDQGYDDSGRPVVLLDTRNAFEVGYGTFTDALDLGITKFTEFPEAVRARSDDLRDSTVVSFCTGGIRCEKAALHLQDLGLEHVFQLDGGIIKYFEEVGEAHFDGDCFVFDEREALTPALHQRVRGHPG